MKRIAIPTWLYLIGVIFLLTTSCRKNEAFKSIVKQGPNPEANFSYTSKDSNPLNIVFTNNSSNGQTYYWQFGDGTSSTEKAPEHTYAASARYQVNLTTRSAAGYSTDTTMKVIAAAPATADFTFSMSGPYVIFTNTSSGVESSKWSFGDQSAESDTLSPSHLYPTAGNYIVNLTVYGIAGDTVIKSRKITITNELISGGGFEIGDEAYWNVWSQQKGIPPVFGYTADKPVGSSGGCLKFPSFTAPSGGSINELMYQPLYVIKGKKYQFSALVKVPGGGSQCYLQFYLSTDPNTWVENNGQPFTNLFMSLNAWHGWGTTNNTAPADGDITGISTYGSYVSTGGVYTATSTGTVYLGIQVGSWQGYSNGELLIDNVSFKQLP